MLLMVLIILISLTGCPLSTTSLILEDTISKIVELLLITVLTDIAKYSLGPPPILILRVPLPSDQLHSPQKPSSMHNLLISSPLSWCNGPMSSPASPARYSSPHVDLLRLFRIQQAHARRSHPRNHPLHLLFVLPRSQQCVRRKVNSFLFRHLPFFLLGIPGLTFSMTLLIWEETRKFLMNMNSNNGEANWWLRNLMW